MDAGMSPAQQRAKDAEAMAWERANRPPSAGEQAKAMYLAYQERVRRAAVWCGVKLPDLTNDVGGPCSFAIQAAMDVRRLYPELRGDGFASEVRKYRAWLMRNVPTVDVVLPGEDSDERVAA